jgi:hypothetical protein
MGILPRKIFFSHHFEPIHNLQPTEMGQVVTGCDHGSNMTRANNFSGQSRWKIFRGDLSLSEESPGGVPAWKE